MPSQKLAQKASQLDGSVDLSVELVVTHNLEERMLLRRRDESGSAQMIFPHGSDLTLEALKRGCGLERRVGSASLVRCSGLKLRFEEHDHQARAPDIQICDRNRTI